MLFDASKEAGKDGRIYVADTNIHVIKVYEPTGVLAFSFGSMGSAAGLIMHPMGVAVNDATNEIYVTDRPVDPKDILCTACHLLGIDPRHELLASPGRPVPLVAGGNVVRELLDSF